MLMPSHIPTPRTPRNSAPVWSDPAGACFSTAPNQRGEPLSPPLPESTLFGGEHQSQSERLGRGGGDLTHLDLFSGIGGFALAAQAAGFRTIGFCEIDKYCQKVLAKNFHGVPIIDDIFDLLCGLKNSRRLHSGISRLDARPGYLKESPEVANSVTQPDFFREALPSADGVSALGSAAPSLCGEVMRRTQEGANGCEESGTQIGNTGTEIQNEKQQNSANGDGGCSQGIATPANSASCRPKATINSTRITSNRGQNFQSTDLKLIMDSLYADHATRGYTVDLITAGFPCQPYSVAGKQRGSRDDRALWPTLSEVIEILQPHFCLLENVPGIIGMELDNVLLDLENLGYACWPVVIPAVAVDARHRRDRVWIVANARGGRCCGPRCGEDEQPGRAEAIGASVVPDAQKRGRQQGGEIARGTREGKTEARQRSGFADSCRVLASSHSFRGDQHSEAGNVSWQVATDHQQPGSGGAGENRGHARWLPEPELGRVAHGIPNRAHRLRGLGNAIVPQVAEVILRAMAETMEAAR